MKTRVLRICATAVNNRLPDLKNQIAFVTEADDTALESQGTPSIEATVCQAQLQFNRWLALEDAERRPARLMDMLGFDYFKLLDLLTIARSRCFPTVVRLRSASPRGTSNGTSGKQVPTPNAGGSHPSRFRQEISFLTNSYALCARIDHHRGAILKPAAVALFDVAALDFEG